MTLLPLILMLTAASWIYISLWFGLAQYLKRLDVIDSAWGLGFIYISLLSIFILVNFELIPLLSIILVSIWGLRLFWHITSRNIKKSEDKRYAAYREKYKGNFALQAYSKIYLVQALLMLMVSAPLIAILSSESFYEPLAYLGMLLWLFGIIYESVADAQLDKFIKSKNKKAVMQTGLWRYSRHPNYFGEIVVWIGAGLVALSAGAWWGLIGPITIIFLLTRVSGVPLIEKRYENDPMYQKYKARTSSLIPLSPKR